MMMAAFEYYLPLILASFLGVMIGWERHVHNHSAGRRTNALVCLGAAAFVMLSLDFPDNSPTRVISQVASGLGFLGAGVILKEGVKIHGLTTAATIWVSGAVGSICGAGNYGDALVVAGLVVAINSLKKHHD
jgi:putative Mg2+ transporter-C (MgtC) family protein